MKKYLGATGILLLIFVAGVFIGRATDDPQPDLVELNHMLSLENQHLQSELRSYKDGE